MRFHAFWKKYVGPLPAGKGIVLTRRAGEVMESARRAAARANRTASVCDAAITLFDLSEGGAATVLSHLGLDRAALRQAAASEPCTAACDDLLPLADKERRTLGHLQVATEHLLVALVVHKNNPVARHVLQQGIDANTIRRELMKRLDPNFGELD